MSDPTSITAIQLDSERYLLSVNQIRELGTQAALAKTRAYCPYSKFRVGAAFLTPTGEIITGVNVENASFPVGTCAERCALGKAVSEGFTEFIALAVSTDIQPPASPCGMCRQFIREFCGLHMPIFMYGGGDSAQSVEQYTVKQLGELLPMSFGPEDLTSR